MSAKRVVVDSSILYYAHNRDAEGYVEEARRRVRGLWHGAADPVVSDWILAEFAESLRAGGVHPEQAAAVTRRYLFWEVVVISVTLFERVLGLTAERGLDTRAAGLVSVAETAGADVIWTTQRFPRESFDSVYVVNPLG
jgi:predicted nucleic acid-binding protein